MKIEQLLNKLNSLLIDYYILVTELRKIERKLRESDNSNPLFLKKDLERRIDYTVEMITDVYAQIDNYFKEGHFSEMSEEVANLISDEYLEIVNNMDPINFMSKLSNMQKCEDILEKNKYLQEEFKILSDNIKTYNRKATVENWSFKIIDPDEALKYYNAIRLKISEDANRFKK